MRIGTCSWKYDSWKGLIYPDFGEFNYLEEYSKQYNTVEIDQWFWSLNKDKAYLLQPNAVAEYNESTPDGFKFTLKRPNILTLTHPYKSTVPNPYFLLTELMKSFIHSIEPLLDKIGLLMFQFEYLNKQKMNSLTEFIKKFQQFRNTIDQSIPIGIEIRNPNYLKEDYFQFLKDSNIAHVFPQGYYMPNITEVFDNFKNQRTSNNSMRPSFRFCNKEEVMAVIYQRGNYIWLAYSIDGKKIRTSLKLDATKQINWKIAREKRDTITARITLNDELLLAKISNSKRLSNIWEHYLIYLAPLKESSKYRYILSYQMFFNIVGNKRIDQIDAIDIENYINIMRSIVSRFDKKLSPNTIIGHLKDIKIFFNFAVEHDFIKKNPIKKNKFYKLKPVQKEVIEIPSTELDEIEAYLKEKNIHQYHIIRFLRLTAMRVSDALAVQWKQIHWKQGYVTHRIAKTNTAQRLPLYTQLNNFLKEFKQTSGPLFPYKNRSSLKFWHAALRALDLPKYNLHQIRKTTITKLIHQGFDFETIHIFSGHADPKTTWKHYVAIRDLIKANKFNPKL